MGGRVPRLPDFCLPIPWDPSLSPPPSVVARVEVWRGRPGHRLKAAHGHPQPAPKSPLMTEAELLPTGVCAFGSPSAWGHICTLRV